MGGDLREEKKRELAFTFSSFLFICLDGTRRVCRRATMGENMFFIHSCGRSLPLLSVLVRVAEGGTREPSE